MSTLQRGVETIDEKSPLAVEPALLLNEIEEEQPREDQQRLHGSRVRSFARELRAQSMADVANRAAKSFEELSRQRLAIERAVEEARVIRAAVRCQ